MNIIKLQRFKKSSILILYVLLVAVLTLVVAYWSLVNKDGGIKKETIINPTSVDITHSLLDAKEYRIIGTKELICTKMASGNTCNGYIIYETESGNRPEGKIINETVVFDGVRNEEDGAALYRADTKPIKAYIEFEPQSNTVKYIKILPQF